jgi:hypothetical protein
MFCFHPLPVIDSAEGSRVGCWGAGLLRSSGAAPPRWGHTHHLLVFRVLRRRDGGTRTTCWFFGYCAAAMGHTHHLLVFLQVLCRRDGGTRTIDSGAVPPRWGHTHHLLACSVSSSCAAAARWGHAPLRSDRVCLEAVDAAAQARRLCLFLKDHATAVRGSTSPPVASLAVCVCVFLGDLF